MSDAQLAPGEPPPSDALIIEEGCCRRCGYDLRGLPVEGRCPECSTAVRLSMQEDWLRCSEPRYVRKLASGVSLLLIGWVCDALSWGFAIVINAMRLVRLVQTYELTAFAAFLPTAAGIWLLTTSDPCGGEEQSFARIRRATRVVLLADLGGRVVAATITISRFFRSPLTVSALNIAASVIGLANIFVLFRYIRKLADRIPDSRLGKRATVAAWGLVICGGIYLAVGSIMFASVRLARELNVPIRFLMGLAGIGALVFYIMMGGFYKRFRRVLVAQAVTSEQFWSQHDPAHQQKNL